MTSAELMRAIGEALFGSQHWQSGLSDALRVNTRTVRRWVAGEEEPRAGVWADLHTIAVKRAADLGALLPELERWGSAD
jgi:hypothetical protein